MRPGATLVRLCGLLAVSALALPLLPPLRWLIVVGGVSLLVATVYEARRLRGIELIAVRPDEITLPLGGQRELKIEIGGDHDFDVRLTMRQRWPALVVPGSSRVVGVLAAGQNVEASFTVEARTRGEAPLEPLWVAMTRFGLIERIVALDAPASLRVVPDLDHLRRLRAELERWALRGLGSRAAPRLGKGRELERLREYVEGDDFRDVAWKATARHGKPIVRAFRLDRSQDILICVDRGHRMAARVANLTRLDHAVDAALQLAFIGQRLEDRVGLLAFAAEVDAGLAQSRGRRHMRALTQWSTALAPAWLHTDYPVLATHVRHRLRSRALVLIITALPELEDHSPVIRAIDTLMPQHLPLVLVLTDPALDASARFRPADLPELHRTLVARDLTAARQRTVTTLRHRGAMVVETTPGDAGVAGVNAYLDIKQRGRL
ncbi:MAG: DUF58 domain-containing protein [Acidobacteriota bacterium]